MTENVCNLLDNLTKHNSRAFGYELSQSEILQILKLFDDVEELERYRAIGTVDEVAEMSNSYINYFHKVRRFEAIGTVDEFKALKEKEEKIKFIINEKHYSDAEECDYGNYYRCENALMIKDIDEIING